MQITIVQSEIEEAIRNYILGQITINDNMQIDIDLSATRGADGFTANINISSAAEKASASKAKKATTKEESINKPLGITETVQHARRGRPPGSTNKTSTPVESKVEASTEISTDTQSTSNTPAPESVPEILAVEEAKPAPISEGKSLFSGLKKPVNEPKADEPADENSVGTTADA